MAYGEEMTRVVEVGEDAGVGGLVHAGGAFDGVLATFFYRVESGDGLKLVGKVTVGEGRASGVEDFGEASLTDVFGFGGVGGGCRDVCALGLKEVEEGLRVLLAGVAGVVALAGSTEREELETLDGVENGGGGVAFAFEWRAGRVPGGGIYDDLQVLVAVRVWGINRPGGVGRYDVQGQAERGGGSREWGTFGLPDDAGNARRGFFRFMRMPSEYVVCGVGIDFCKNRS
eukprot:Plantae.Rhodophyta-Palmaria_palmata.ctg19840.p1 GENE.Plantae.Rhodophyta-Palmaria_palmata.ctg19840~~Plantae.Rhodophyta-Palmaria_palmata.ctg19840.p1  ORF type:complete len:260 (-),score=40.83 Plantae.Rhodophyta-Palmaria_palmata.ctg19840:23-709(-)